MMEEETSENIKFIQLLNTKIDQNSQGNIKFVLFHEHLAQNLSKLLQKNQNQESSINLENLTNIQKFPYTNHSNLVINDVKEVDHELNYLKELEYIILVDSTNTEFKQDIDKLHEIQKLSKTQIIRGYTYYLDPNVKFENENHRKAILTQENIYKQVEFEFSIGSQNSKPAFIGEIQLDNFDLNQEMYQCIIQAYSQFSNKHNVPVLFECNSNDIQMDLAQYFENENKSQCVFFNPLLTYENGQIKDDNLSLDIYGLDKVVIALKQGCTVGFDLSRQIVNEIQFLEVVKHLVQQYSSQIILSYGLKFKTDFKKYGGVGFEYLNQFYKKLQDQNVGEQELRAIFRDNQLKLLTWKKQEIIKVQIIWWTCPMCKQDFDEAKVEKWKKFGVEYCSVSCLKKAIK